MGFVVRSFDINLLPPYNKWSIARGDTFIWVKDPSKIKKERVFARMMEKEALCMRKINLKRKVNVNLNMFIALNLSERYW